MTSILSLNRSNPAQIQSTKGRVWFRKLFLEDYLICIITVISGRIYDYKALIAHWTRPRTHIWRSEALLKGSEPWNQLTSLLWVMIESEDTPILQKFSYGGGVKAISSFGNLNGLASFLSLILIKLSEPLALCGIQKTGHFFLVNQFLRKRKLSEV